MRRNPQAGCVYTALAKRGKFHLPVNQDIGLSLRPYAQSVSTNVCIACVIARKMSIYYACLVGKVINCVANRVIDLSGSRCGIRVAQHLTM